MLYYFSLIFSHIAILFFEKKTLIKTIYFLWEKTPLGPCVPFLEPATVVIILWNSLIFLKIFSLPQVNRSVNISDTNGPSRHLHVQS